MSKINDTVRHFKIAWYGLLSLLVLLFIILSLANSKSLSSIEIRIKDGQDEVYDKKIPFVTKKGEELPDYKLSYLMDERWHTIGTVYNTSAKDWVKFDISDPPNLTLVQAIHVSDDDAAKDDHLEEVQILDVAPQGRMFDYKISTVFSFKSGMIWFAKTPLGIAIFGAIGLAVFLVVISYISV